MMTGSRLYLRRKFRVFLRLFLVIGLFGLLCGCVATGRQVKPAEAAQIIVGKTTKQEVSRILGPATSTVSENGRTVFTYWHQDPQALGNHKEIFSVLFNEQGIAERVHTYQRDYKITQPDTHANRISTKKELDQIVATIVRRQTKMEDMIRILNTPDDERLTLKGEIQWTWHVWDRYYSLNNELFAALTVVCDKAGTVSDFIVTERLVR